MLVNQEDQLHRLARAEAGLLVDPDRKQLRFNEIVSCALEFYPEHPEAGVRELVRSCDKTDPRYVRKAPMWAVLRDQYKWMLG